MNDQWEINAVTEAIIGAAIEVHRQLDSQLLRVLRNSAFIKFDESQQYNRPHAGIELVLSTTEGGHATLFCLRGSLSGGFNRQEMLGRCCRIHGYSQDHRSINVL